MSPKKIWLLTKQLYENEFLNKNLSFSVTKYIVIISYVKSDINFFGGSNHFSTLMIQAHDPYHIVTWIWRSKRDFKLNEEYNEITRFRHQVQAQYVEMTNYSYLNLKFFFIAGYLTRWQEIPRKLSHAFQSTRTRGFSFYSIVYYARLI